jgi:hypothetical protein
MKANYTIRLAAEKLGLKVRRLRKWAREFSGFAVKVGHLWMIPAENLALVAGSRNAPLVLSRVFGGRQ